MLALVDAFKENGLYSLVGCWEGEVALVLVQIPVEGLGVASLWMIDRWTSAGYDNDTLLSALMSMEMGLGG
jgi:hypothetical protein